MQSACARVYYVRVCMHRCMMMGECIYTRGGGISVFNQDYLALGQSTRCAKAIGAALHAIWDARIRIHGDRRTVLAPWMNAGAHPHV